MQQRSHVRMMFFSKRCPLKSIMRVLSAKFIEPTAYRKRSSLANATEPLLFAFGPFNTFINDLPGGVHTLESSYDGGAWLL